MIIVNINLKPLIDDNAVCGLMSMIQALFIRYSDPDIPGLVFYCSLLPRQMFTIITPWVMTMRIRLLR